MKKAISIFILLVLLCSTISSASAVELKGVPTTDKPAGYQQVNILLDGSGKVCGLLSRDENNTAVSLHEVATTLSGYSCDAGKLVRSKTGHIVTLTEDGYLSAGHSVISATLQIMPEGMAIFQYLGLSTANEVNDATIVAERLSDGTFRAYHRFLDSNKGTEVGRLYAAGSSKYASIRYADWDGDGDMELCYRAGLAKKSSSNKSHGGGSSGSTGGGNGGNGSSRPPVQHSQNNYNDGGSSSSGSSSSSNSRPPVSHSTNNY